MNDILKHNYTEGAINGDLFIKSGKDIFLDATIIEDVFTNGRMNIKDFSMSNGVKFALFEKSNMDTNHSEKKREKTVRWIPQFECSPIRSLELIK